MITMPPPDGNLEDPVGLLSGLSAPVVIDGSNGPGSLWCRQSSSRSTATGRPVGSS